MFVIAYDTATQSVVSMTCSLLVHDKLGIEIESEH